MKDPGLDDIDIDALMADLGLTQQNGCCCDPVRKLEGWISLGCKEHGLQTMRAWPAAGGRKPSHGDIATTVDVS